MLHQSQHNSRKFLRRTDHVTGLTQSICSSCYATIARARQDRVLDMVEWQHDCPTRRPLARIARA
jgi:hypothetical protein